MERKKREKNRGGTDKGLLFISRPLFYALCGSLGLHLILLFFQVPQLREKNSSSKKIRLVLNSKKKQRRLLQPKSKQIVDSEESKTQELAPKSRFYGKKNQKFERQTVSKKVGSFRVAGKGLKEGTSQKIPTTKRITNNRGHLHNNKKKKVTRAKRENRRLKKKRLSLSDLAMGGNDLQRKQWAERPLAPLGTLRGVRGKRGLSQNNDFVEDLPLGDMTRLNTVEYKYYSFYHRIKKKLEKHWGHSLRQKAEKLWKRGRRLPASEHRITSLVITLNNKGDIIDITVKGTSGIRELDEAAIESFNKAGPFPNPPKGMVQNGKAEIEWGFVVKS